MRVNYNVSAMIANNALKRTDTKLSDSLARLSSGMKVVNAKDNPSGLAMSRRMNAQIEGMNVANDSANDGISIVQIADGSLSSVHEILQRMNELAVKASTDSLTNDDRKVIQSEITQLKDEIERIAQTTQYNGQNLLDGSFDLKGYATVGNDPATAKTDVDAAIKVIGFSDVMEEGQYVISGLNITYEEIGPKGAEKKKIDIQNPANVTITRDGVDYMNQNMNVECMEDVLVISDSTGKSIKIKIDKDLSENLNIDLTTTGSMTMQVGANEGQKLDIRIPKVSLNTLGIYNLDVSPSSDEARFGVDKIKNAISEISSIRSRLGSYQNRLEHTAGNLDISVENMTAAYSRIMDVDMAEEMTFYSTQQVLSQAGTSMLAQANERPSQVLQLLQ
ncbi:flagellin N-terminal helical domain-containing protein [Butyrivibrio sp. YAB3001]|uniref:flagellin N-terminal helical domain-containing protein n=1 Tax=Butyrivibrio sp. YAB3001 TaxID=1520812 RepID=UPI0008F65763|nr:flagellin [Butyrivibrio sp. YAB3001]SFC83705.1 flagellin [Butyrivibrio sp. YAB3001]